MLFYYAAANWMRNITHLNNVWDLSDVFWRDVSLLMVIHHARVIERWLTVIVVTVVAAGVSACQQLPSVWGPWSCQYLINIEISTVLWHLDIKTSQIWWGIRHEDVEAGKIWCESHIWILNQAQYYGNYVCCVLSAWCLHRGWNSRKLLYSPKAFAGWRVSAACSLHVAGGWGVAGPLAGGGGVRVRDWGRCSVQGALLLCRGLGVADLLCPCWPWLWLCPPVLLSPEPHPPPRPRFLRRVFFLL